MPIKQINKLHDIEMPFWQHGYTRTATAGDNHYKGRCPFCAGGDKFYINHKTGAWDCKRCKRHGGYQIFLQEMFILGQDNFKRAQPSALSIARGLMIRSLRDAEIGYNPDTKKYLIPIWDIEHKSLLDLRTYDGKLLRSTKGSKSGLFYWNRIEKQHRTIWLCEGEWDTIAMNEALKKLEIEDEIAVGVAGGRTFKDEWVTLFHGKNVNVVYDNDETGEEGQIKVYNKLANNVKKIQFLHWPVTYAQKYDIRDHYLSVKKKAEIFYDDINTLLRDLPKSEAAKEFEKGKDPFELYDGPGLDCEVVYKKYKEWLEMEDTAVLDVMFGSVLANRLPGDPVWLFVMGPSGAMKTELLMSLRTAPDMEHISSLTPHTLISGANFGGSGDPSLIPKLDGKILVVKDFTTILNMNNMNRDEIFGILRDAYDGEAAKPFGNGVYRIYKSKFGLLAGVTKAIELYTEGHTALGERFLRFEVHQGDELKVLQRVAHNTQLTIKNGSQDTTMRDTLSDIGKAVLNHHFEHIPDIPPNIIAKVIGLAQWTAMLRGSINREKYSREITHKPFCESPTRLTRQYTKLLYGIGQFRRVPIIGDTEYSRIVSIARATIPSRLEEVVRVLYKNGPGKYYEPKDITDIIGLPRETSKVILDNLALLGVLHRKKITNITYKWGLHPKQFKLIQECRIYDKPNMEDSGPSIVRVCQQRHPQGVRTRKAIHGLAVG